MQSFPLNSVLSDVIEKLKDADYSKIFSAPVTEEEAPGYSALGLFIVIYARFKFDSFSNAFSLRCHYQSHGPLNYVSKGRKIRI